MKTYSAKIAEKLSSNEEEREIIHYGLHQGFVILLNVLTVVICGILWKELPFTLFVFWGIFFLRPYAGGYHADTESSCYLISTATMNAAIWAKSTIILSNAILVGIWIGTAAFIWRYTPVENPVHCLDENERKKYKKNARGILLCYAVLLLLGICMHQQSLIAGTVWCQVLIVIAMVAGLWKYRKSVNRIL